MNFYRLAKRFVNIRSGRIKVLSLWFAHTMRMRYIGVFLDPVMACNIRCRMCYFSDDAKRPKPLRPIDEAFIDRLGRSLLHRAAKLQIGCGAEPTLYRDLPMIIRKAKTAGVPYVEITSNCQLLDYDALKSLVDAGLDGITMSLHGTTQQTYEYLMDGAKYDRLKRFIDALREIKKENPDFKLRINYTFNNLNIDELGRLWNLFDAVDIDILQIRPIQRLGDTAYDDFDLSGIAERYDEVIAPEIEECRRRGTTFIGPTRQNLTQVDDRRSSLDALIEEITYCYVSGDSCYREGFDPAADTFESYHRRRHTRRRLLAAFFRGNDKRIRATEVSKKLNYTVK